jgi:hypothetical protein
MAVPEIGFLEAPHEPIPMMIAIISGVSPMGVLLARVEARVASTDPGLFLFVNWSI